jgi:glycosyltransferase involved in cell wall biosynthesis
MKRIVCFGPGPAFKGGISNYNTALAKALARQPDTEVHIVSWTQQYPAIIPRDFKDRASRSDLLEGTGIEVSYLTNYNSPASWGKTYRFIRDLKPDIVIFQWAITLQGLPMGRIARMLKKHSEIDIIFDVHNMSQKETSILDRFFTQYCLKIADNLIVHAQLTIDDLRATFPDRDFAISETGERHPSRPTIIKLYHPVYDIFTPDPDFDTDAFKKTLGLRKHVFLYFGFIRKYKGLHNLIPAFAKVVEKCDDASLLIVGESFWKTLDNTRFSTKVKNALFSFAKSVFLKKSDDEREYNPLALVEELGLEQDVAIVNEFVPNEDVHRYFQVSDALITYYTHSAPSGVESLAYNFHMPVLATRVGHFPETIKEGFNGYLAEPENIESMAEQMLKFIDQPIDRNNVAQTAANMSWENYAKAILNEEINK